MVELFLEGVRRLFPWNGDIEISLEANPSGISLEKLRGYRVAGVNRVSFGVQSFSSNTLTLLGRDHSSGEAVKAVGIANQAGFEDISLDLIYGVPGQTMLDLEVDLTEAVSLPIQHLSAYALTIEQGTPFFQRRQRGLLVMPSDDVVAEMMDVIPEFLARRGFYRYEISNYARPERESRHNMAYWIGTDYLGIGAGAHSLVVQYDGPRRVAGLRWCNLAQPAAYMRNVRGGELISWREHLSPNDLMFEFFYLGLRLSRGVSRRQFEELFEVSVAERFGLVLEKLIRGGFLEEVEDRLRLTEHGLKLSDSVFECLISPENQ
jgi:oxygen-independent coproporphyrinogen-3 oxidase